MYARLCVTIVEQGHFLSSRHRKISITILARCNYMNLALFTVVIYNVHVSMFTVAIHVYSVSLPGAHWSYC